MGTMCATFERQAVSSKAYNTAKDMQRAAVYAACDAVQQAVWDKQHGKPHEDVDELLTVLRVVSTHQVGS